MFDKASLLAEYLPLAEAAYIMEHTQCTLPEGFSLLGPITTTSGVNYGFVAERLTDGTLMIVFRGTHDLKDWEYDLGAIPVPLVFGFRSGLVHLGFASLYKSMRDSLQKILAQYPKAKRLEIEGHSLGGALAVCCAYDLAFLKAAYSIKVLTFAAPRVGDLFFAMDFNRLIPEYARFENFGDMVPEVPFDPPYLHPGKVWLVRGGFDILDPRVAHSLVAYKAGVEAAQW